MLLCRDNHHNKTMPFKNAKRLVAMTHSPRKRQKRTGTCRFDNGRCLQRTTRAKANGRILLFFSCVECNSNGIGANMGANSAANAADGHLVHINRKMIGAVNKILVEQLVGKPTVCG